MQFGTSKAEVKHGKFSLRLRSFFKGGRSVRAAQPMDVHDVQSQNESQMVDEHDRSTKLNLEDWPLEDSFKPVSIFLDSMPSNSQDAEPERSIRTPSPSSVSSSKRSSLHEASIQLYQKQDQQLNALEQQMDEMSIFLAQSTLRREKLLARALAQMQSINAEVQIHLRHADINISNCVESEPLTPPTKDRGWTQRLWTPQPCVLLTLCLNITPVTMGCASATSTQVIRRINEYQSHSPFPYRRIL